MPAWTLLLALRLAAEPSEPLPALELQWSAPTSCPSEASVRRRIAAYVEGAGSARAMQARAEIDRDGPQWTLHLTFGEHTRTLSGASCEELSEAAAVILSIALTPAPASSPAPPWRAPARELPPPPPLPPPTPAPPPSPPAPAEDAPWRGLVRVDAGLGLGITPTLTTGRLSVGALRRRTRAELAGTLWVPAEVPARSGSPRAWVSLGTVHFQLCRVWPRGAVDLTACAGVAVGALRIDRLASTHAVRHRVWAGGTAGFALVWPFRPHLGLWVGPEVTASLRQPELPRLATGARYRSPSVAIRGALGLEVVFPSRTRGAAGKRGR